MKYLQKLNEFYFEKDEEARLAKFVDQLSFGDELVYDQSFYTGRGMFPNTKELKKELDSKFQLLLIQKAGRNTDIYVGSDDLVFILQPDLGAKNYMQISISSTKEQWNDKAGVFTKQSGYKMYESVVNESIQSGALAKAISKSIMKINESMSYKDFALAVGQILRDDYGQHNFEPFMKVLNDDLGIK